MSDLTAILHPPGYFELAARAAALWLRRERKVRKLDLGEPGSAGDPSRRQFVTASGHLVDNGWLWLERTSRRPLDVGGNATGMDTDALLLSEEGNPELAALGIEATHIARVEPFGDGWRLVGDRAGTLLCGYRDRYERPSATPPIEIARARERIRLALIGEEHHLREVYPANQAALGDAADLLNVVLELRIVSPLALDHARARSLLGEVDALVLPGGCDDRQVEGQILLAGLALELEVPTLGLCFGMQSMATAVIRERLGYPEATLEELDPEASIHSFIALRDQHGALRHRLGSATSRLRPASRAAGFYATHSVRERMHHRYRLAPRWHHPLEQAGISISAWAADDAGIADVIEAQGNSFFVGIQGHPELSSSERHPHPGFVALLEAVLARR